MTTSYRVKTGSTEMCDSCGCTYAGGDRMIRLTSHNGERLGSCCWDCFYEEDQDDVWG